MFPRPSLGAILGADVRVGLRKMRQAVLVLMTVAVMSASPIKAGPAPDPTTVRFLYQTCKDETAANGQRFCLGYILGVGQLMAVNADYGDNFALCSRPKGTVPTGREMIQAFVSCSADWSRASHCCFSRSPSP